MLGHWLFSMFQCAPIMLWAFWELSYFKRMRAAARDGIRTAQLKPRRLFDFASARRQHVLQPLCCGGAGLDGPQQEDGPPSGARRQGTDASRRRADFGRDHGLAQHILECHDTLIAFRVLHYVPILVSLFVQVLAVLATTKLGLVAPFGQEDEEAAPTASLGARAPPQPSLF
jgi:hypothetical protein